MAQWSKLKNLAFGGFSLLALTAINNCGRPMNSGGASNITTTGFVRNVVMTEGTRAGVQVVMSQKTETTLVYTWSIQGQQVSNRFGTTSGSFTVPANSLNASFEIQSLDDAKYDLEKNFTLVFTPTSNSQPAIPQVQLKVTERLGRPNLTASNTAIEGGQSGAVLFQISAPIAFETDFMVQTLDGSALVGRDYRAVSQKVVIPAGQTAVSVPLVSLRDSGLFSQDRSFSLLARESAVLNIGPSARAEVLVFDRERRIAQTRIDIADARGLEGESLRVRVSLNQPSPFNVLVDFVMTDISARASADYVLQNGTLTIPAGQTSAFIMVGTLRDNLYEGQAENLRINLSNPRQASLGQKIEALIEIDDADALPTLNVVNVMNGREGAMASVELALSARASRPVSFKWSTAAGSAGNADYTAVTDRMVTIPAGQISAFLTVPITIDNLAEGEESFSIALSALQNATAQRSTIPLKILSGHLPAVSVQVARATEGSEANVTMILDRANPGADVLVTWHTELMAGSSAARASDVFIGRGQSIIPRGQLVAFGNIPTFEDQLHESTEHYRFVIDSVSGADRAQSELRAEIADNDAQPVITTAVANALEGQNTVLRARLSKISGKDVRIDWSTVDGTARSGSDYSAQTNAVAVIPAGQLFVDMPVATHADSQDEDNETFLYQISSVNGAAVAPADMRRTAVVVNTDPVISLVGSSVSEGGFLTFTIYLSFASQQEASVVVETLDGTALALGDYQRILPTRITIPAGSMQKQVRVRTNLDSLTEGNETVRLKLSSPTNLTLPAKAAIATGTILGQ